MGNTQDGFGKKRDHNQYGEVEKEKDEKKKGQHIPDSKGKKANTPKDE